MERRYGRSLTGICGGNSAENYRNDMTSGERDIATALGSCSFLPGSFDKRFARQLQERKEKPMTEKGRAMMLKLAVKYRRQIPNLSRLFRKVHIEETTVK